MLTSNPNIPHPPPYRAYTTILRNTLLEKTNAKHSKLQLEVDGKPVGNDMHAHDPHTHTHTHTHGRTTDKHNAAAALP